MLMRISCDFATPTLVLTLALLTVPVLFGPPVGIAAYAACLPGDRVDGSTAAQAKERMQAAGYSNVRDLKKGCDNYWHGIAVKNGADVHVVLAPQGQVMTEGD
jgi:hypothetical protein